MKNKIFFLCGILVSVILINVSCGKEIPDIPRQPIPPPPFLLPSPNQTIWVDANMNITIELPLNFAILNGIAFGPGTNGASINWEKISGPASCLIENPDSLITKVANLENGIYQFGLTVTTTSGEISFDTMTLKVQDATSTNKQIFFSNLNWSCPFGCSIVLGDILSYIPTNGQFSAYIKTDENQFWQLIVPDSIFTGERYSYNISSGQLSVYEYTNFEATDHPEIKIVF
ncbi:MAG TPA: hypothetical protein VFN95_08330 [Flavitalea sp.]|nr:hypothetical protein [Flavitalea sp.]